MPGKDFFFMLTRSEVSEVIKKVTDKEPDLHAALFGMYDSIIPDYFKNDLQLLPLERSLSYRNDNRFIIQMKDESFRERVIPQKAGGIKIILEANESRNYASVSWGGIDVFEKKVLAGELLISNNNAISKYIFQLFQKEIKSFCTHKDDRFYISHGVMELYAKNYTLCFASVYQSPDLVSDPLPLKKKK